MNTDAIHTALLSFGMSGKLFHAPFLDVHPGFNLYSVWERSKQTASSIYENTRSVKTFEEILDDPRVELVIVNTPNYTHFEYASKALLAGKHVVVEKPFTVTGEEAELLIHIAKEQDRKLTVYHNRRWDSDFLTVKKIIASGILGDVVDAEIHFDRYSPNLSPKLHKEKAGPGTGVLHDLGSHLIDAAIQIFGHPQAVYADLRIVRENSEVTDYMDLLLYYTDKRVHLKSSYFVKEALPGFIIHGKNGSFFKARSDNQEAELLKGSIPGSENWGVEPDHQQGWFTIMETGNTIRKFVDSEQGNYMMFYDLLFASLRHNAPLPVLPEDGLIVMKIIDAALLSNANHQMIKLDLS